MNRLTARISLALAAVAWLSAPYACFADTQLIFRTPEAGATIAADGSFHDLGTVDVRQYRQIRIVANVRAGGPVLIVRLAAVEGNGPAIPMKDLFLNPNTPVTEVYDVPGTRLKISAGTPRGGNTAAVLDLLVYGN